MTSALKLQMGIKRVLDLLVSGCALVLLAPILALIASGVKLTMGSPVLFRQARPGLHGKPFTMLKFRTMRDESNANGQPLPDGERVTAFGRFLRKTSLDELPELLNVLSGEMSLVGPRPLLLEYLPRYTAEQRRRHAMRPGITGLAQINGRQNITFAQRIALDIRYVDEWSLGLDIKILLLTLPRVLVSSGVVVGQDVRDVDDLGPDRRL